MEFKGQINFLFESDEDGEKITETFKKITEVFEEVDFDINYFDVKPVEKAEVPSWANDEEDPFEHFENLDEESKEMLNFAMDSFGTDSITFADDDEEITYTRETSKINEKDLIGMKIDDITPDMNVRVSVLNGVPQVVTRDFVRDRINVVVEQGVITEIAFKG